MMELRIILKNYDLQKNMDVSGTVHLLASPLISPCFICPGEPIAWPWVQTMDIFHMDIEAEKKLNKN